MLLDYPIIINVHGHVKKNWKLPQIEGLSKSSSILSTLQDILPALNELIITKTPGCSHFSDKELTSEEPRGEAE